MYTSHKSYHCISPVASFTHTSSLYCMCSSLNTQIFISLDIHCLCHCKESIPDHHDLHHFISVCYVLKQVIAFFTMVVAALFTNDAILLKAYQKSSSTLLFKLTHHCIYFTIITVHTLHKAYIKVLLLSTPRVLLLQKFSPKLPNSPLDNCAFNQEDLPETSSAYL